MRCIRTRRPLVCAVLASVLSISALTACGSDSGGGGGGGGGGASAAGSGSGDVAVSAAQACTKAKQEQGDLSYVASTDEAVFAKEIAGFEAKYPYIKVKYTNLRSSDATQRLLVEQQARHSLDFDAMAGEIGGFDPLFQAGLVRTVDWAKLGLPPNLVLEHGGANLIRNYRLFTGIGYNSKLVKPGELPTTWQDLINSKWAGKIIVDPRGQYLGGLALAWGASKTTEWFKQFMATDKPLIIQGATASGQKVIAGEALVTTSAADANIREAQAAGAPIAIKYLDVVPTSDYYTLIMKTTPRPNKAACFLSWMIGPDGAKQKEKYEFQFNVDKAADLPSGSQVVLADTPDKIKLQTDEAGALAKLMSK